MKYVATELEIKGKKFMNNEIKEIGAATIQPGNRVFGPFNIQKGAAGFIMSIDSTQHLNSGVVVEWGLQISLDGGSTYRDVAGGARTGGTYDNEEGGTVTDFFMEAGLPEPDNANRKIKIFLNVTGGSLITSGGTVTVIKP